MTDIDRSTGDAVTLKQALLTSAAALKRIDRFETIKNSSDHAIVVTQHDGVTITIPPGVTVRVKVS